MCRCALAAIAYIRLGCAYSIALARRVIRNFGVQAVAMHLWRDMSVVTALLPLWRAAAMSRSVRWCGCY